MARFRKTTRPRRLIRKQEVLHRTGYSHTTIWRLEKAGLFPLRVQLSPMAVGWFEDEVDEWIASRIRQGGKKPSVLAPNVPRPPEPEAPPPAPTRRRRLSRLSPGRGREPASQDGGADRDSRP
jgi:predicted DNA-binding transcriptional regulator AlpA